MGFFRNKKVPETLAERLENVGQQISGPTSFSSFSNSFVKEGKRRFSNIKHNLGSPGRSFDSYKGTKRMQEAESERIINQERAKIRNARLRANIREKYGVTSVKKGKYKFKKPEQKQYAEYDVDDFFAGL